MSNKRIGIYDYRLDNFHADVYLEVLRGPLAHRGYQIIGAAALVEKPSRDWCLRNDVPYFDSLEELAKETDCLMILAPSNPEKHLEMCERAFPHGRPTFVDKTFAPNLSQAEKIFECADQHSVAIQSTSALRSTNIQQIVKESKSTLQSMIIYASGTSFEEYGIHPFELAISCLGPEVSALCRLGTNDFRQYVLLLSENRSAVINFSQTAEMPFQATLITGDGSQHVEIETDQLFANAAANILDFFDAGEALIDRRETLIIRRLLDLATGDESSGRFLDVMNPQTAETALLSPPHWLQRQTERLTK